MHRFQPTPENTPSEQLQNLENKETLPTYLSWCFILSPWSPSSSPSNREADAQPSICAEPGSPLGLPVMIF